MSVRGSRLSRVAMPVRRGDPLHLEVLACRIVPLALDVGFPGVRGRQGGVIGSFEFRQVPAQPLVAADDSSAARPDDDESFLLKGLQGAAGSLAAHVVVAG